VRNWTNLCKSSFAKCEIENAFAKTIKPADMRTQNPKADYSKEISELFDQMQFYCTIYHEGIVLTTSDAEYIHLCKDLNRFFKIDGRPIVAVTKSMLADFKIKPKKRPRWIKKMEAIKFFLNKQLKQNYIPKRIITFDEVSEYLTQVSNKEKGIAIKVSSNQFQAKKLTHGELENIKLDELMKEIYKEWSETEITGFKLNNATSLTSSYVYRSILTFESVTAQDASVIGHCILKFENTDEHLELQLERCSVGDYNHNSNKVPTGQNRVTKFIKGYNWNIILLNIEKTMRAMFQIPNIDKSYLNFSLGNINLVVPQEIFYPVKSGIPMPPRDRIANRKYIHNVAESIALNKVL
jgi:hypothetical protein